MQEFYLALHIIIKARNEVLLLKKPHDGEVFNTFPGGRIDEGEGISEAINRELEEEVGFNTDGLKAVFKSYFLLGTNQEKRDKPLIISVLYQIDIKEKFKPILSEDHGGYEWISWDDFLETEIHFDQVKAKELLESNLEIEL
jgi:8-oxo-dGTP pyrophosphatase MutT (NUDIX family)